jgi:FAD/FMN-containing dehydrogenase
VNTIPKLTKIPGLTPETSRFLDALKAKGFKGDILTDYASRLVNATDNSVYQILPQAVVAPKSSSDVELLTSLLAEKEHHKVTVSPRGGGTGTNGQSLTPGIIVDLSRHMYRILELDKEAGWVRVQPGVVLDQLNAYLKPHGLFFAPSVSPSSRAE